MARLTRKSKPYLVKSLTASLGVLSIIWTLSSWSANGTEAELASFAQRILLGEVFGSDQSNALKLALDTTSASRPSALALDSIAVIRLRLVENALSSGDRGASASERKELGIALTSALSDDPTNSFLWLADYWLQKTAVATSDEALRLLNMSYLLGPNEAWIAVKRNPLAIGIFSSLPNELSERVKAEFVGMVRSGLDLDAIHSLSVSQDHVREQMLGQLVQIKEVDRIEFAKLLRSKDIEWSVPGVVESTARPF